MGQTQGGGDGYKEGRTKGGGGRHRLGERTFRLADRDDLRAIFGCLIVTPSSFLELLLHEVVFAFVAALSRLLLLLLL